MNLKRWFDRLGLQARVLLCVFLPLWILAGSITYSLFSRLEAWVEERMQEDVELVARALGESISHALERDRPGSVVTSLETTARIGRLYGAAVYSPAGQVIATAGGLPNAAEPDPSIMELILDDRQTGTYGHVNGRAVYSYFVPLVDSDANQVGLLQVARLHRDMLETIQRLRSASFASLLILAFVMAGFIFLGYYGAAGKSLVELSRAMERVERGEREHRAAGGGPREISALADSFNRMLDSIRRAEQEISRRREREVQLQKNLARKERLAALGRVAAGIAHELGTPLGIVDGKAQRLLRRTVADPEVAESTRSIRAEVQRMENIIRQLLEFGRSHDAQRKTIEAAFLVRNAIRAVEPVTAEQQATIEMGDGARGARVEVNPLRAEICIVNLLKNAVQASPGGKVEVALRADGDHLYISVSDQGPGIPPEVAGDIFEPFVTTRSGKKGTGLGLAIAHQVAVENGGTLSYRNLDGGGACFSLRLPLTEEEV